MDSKFDRYPQSLPTNDLSSFPLSPFVYTAPTNLENVLLALPKNDQYDLPILDVAIVDIDDKPRTTTLLVASLL
eukprot:scaffold282433_cov28-Attheya_sp.AAC.1